MANEISKIGCYVKLMLNVTSKTIGDDSLFLISIPSSTNRLRISFF